jgi:hypothetical protein
VLLSAGVLLNVLFPNWLLTFLLTALLLWLTIRIGRKAARLYKVHPYFCPWSFAGFQLGVQMDVCIGHPTVGALHEHRIR